MSMDFGTSSTLSLVKIIGLSIREAPLPEERISSVCSVDAPLFSSAGFSCAASEAQREMPGIISEAKIIKVVGVFNTIRFTPSLRLRKSSIGQIRGPRLQERKQIVCFAGL